LIILEQRKLRLNGDVHSIQKEIGSLNLGYKNLNTEMKRINLIMADNKFKIGKLQDDNRHLESDFI
jgi:hypothetical protein